MKVAQLVAATVEALCCFETTVQMTLKLRE